MHVRKIRTMRNVWNDLAGRASDPPQTRGTPSPARLAMPGELVRIQNLWSSPGAGCVFANENTVARKLTCASAHRRNVQPWVFRRTSARTQRRVKGRVMPVTTPKATRKFKTPFVWFVAPAGIAVCGLMMYSLSNDTWARLALWTAIGLVI